MKRSALLWSLGVSASVLAADAVDPPVDYSLYNHEILVESLRSGNHDESGTNDYFFTAAVQAMVNSKEELKKEIVSRERITGEPAKFSELKLDVLSLFEADPKNPTSNSLKIVGNDIRVLVSQAMRKFNLLESEVAVMVEITMYEKEKFLGYFGEDKLIGKTSYFPIPPTKYQLGGRVNTKLSLLDDKGTDVRFKITYEKPAAADAQELKPPTPAIEPSK